MALTRKELDKRDLLILQGYKATGDAMLLANRFHVTTTRIYQIVKKGNAKKKS